MNITHVAQSPYIRHIPRAFSRTRRLAFSLIAATVVTVGSVLAWSAVDNSDQTAATTDQVPAGAVANAVELRRQLDSTSAIGTDQVPAGAVANAVELRRQLDSTSAIGADQVPAGAVANAVELQRQLDSMSAIGTDQVPAGAVANAVELQRQLDSTSAFGTDQVPAGAVANAVELQRPARLHERHRSRRGRGDRAVACLSPHPSFKGRGYPALLLVLRDQVNEPPQRCAHRR